MAYVTNWERIAKKEGIKEEKKEAARRMLNDDVAIEKIVKYTGLTEKEIRELMH